MMKTPQIAITLLSSAMLLALSGGIAAAEHQDVKVGGDILPGGCRMDFGENGNLVDLGDIDPDDLNRDEFTWLRERKIVLFIRCDRPTKVALTTSSSRGASAVNESGRLSDVALVGYRGQKFERVGAYGLGLAGNKGIGGYTMRMIVSVIDGDRQHESLLTSDGSLSYWIYSRVPSGDFLINYGARRYVSWGEGSYEDDNPVAFTTLEAPVTVDAYINKASALDLSKPIRIDGMAVFDMIYL